MDGSNEVDKDDRLSKCGRVFQESASRLWMCVVRQSGLYRRLCQVSEGLHSQAGHSLASFCFSRFTDSVSRCCNCSLSRRRSPLERLVPSVERRRLRSSLPFSRNSATSCMSAGQRYI